MPRTGLGRARLAPRVDLVSRPLDFEYYPGVFKFQISAFYGLGHAIPTRPLPSHRKLPFSQVCLFEIRMRLFRKHVELLS